MSLRPSFALASLSASPAARRKTSRGFRNKRLTTLMVLPWAGTAVAFRRAVDESGVLEARLVGWDCWRRETAGGEEYTLEIAADKEVELAAVGSWSGEAAPARSFPPWRAQPRSGEQQVVPALGEPCALLSSVDGWSRSGIHVAVLSVAALEQLLRNKHTKAWTRAARSFKGPPGAASLVNEGELKAALQSYQHFMAVHSYKGDAAGLKAAVARAVQIVMQL